MQQLYALHQTVPLQLLSETLLELAKRLHMFASAIVMAVLGNLVEIVIVGPVYTCESDGSISIQTRLYSLHRTSLSWNYSNPLEAPL